jgi:hypothetical protein
MPVLIRYAGAGLTRAQYDEVGEKLQAQGSWPAEGLILHVSFGRDGDMRVSEVWESREQLERFQERLFPILQEVGVPTTPEPELFEVQEVLSVEYSTAST